MHATQAETYLFQTYRLEGRRTLNIHGQQNC